MPATAGGTGTCAVQMCCKVHQQGVISPPGSGEVWGEWNGVGDRVLWGEVGHPRSQCRSGRTATASYPPPAMPEISTWTTQIQASNSVGEDPSGPIGTA